MTGIAGSGKGHSVPGKYLIIISLLIICSPLKGQQRDAVPEYRFDATTQYAGGRNPGESSIEFTYMFTNIGQVPVQVSGVNPCQRCEVVTMSRGIVRPGGRGFVAIRYKLPPNPGRFMETFQVYMNNEIHKPVKLSFNGELLPAPREKVQVYAYCYGDVCVSDERLDVGRGLNTSLISKEFTFMNGGNSPLELSGPPLHDYLVADVYPSPLMPGEKGTLKVTYRAAQRHAFGPLKDTLTLYSRSDEIPPIEIPLSVYIDEDFSKLKPDQVTVSPQVSFSETRRDIGAIKRGEETQCTFEIRNKGRRQLIIRNIFATSPMIQVEMPNRVLRQGQTGEIKVFITATAPKGQFMETITIICNDPKRPEANLYVQGVILDP